MRFLDNAKDLVGKAQDLAAEHSEQIKDGIDKVEHLADKATGGKFTSAIDGAGAKAADYVDGLDKTT